MEGRTIVKRKTVNHFIKERKTEDFKGYVVRYK